MGISVTKTLIFSLVLSFSTNLWGSNSRYNYDRTEEAQEVSSFWSQHKVGVGVATAGAYGLAGGLVSILFHPQWSVDLGFGGGSHFHSFGFRIKRMMLLSSPLNPYFGFGFNRWQRSSSRPFNSASLSPGYIVKEFLSEDERARGLIDEKLVHASLGLQYTFTSGDWQGYGFFLEGVFMISAEDFDTAPTLSLGFNYFF